MPVKRKARKSDKEREEGGGRNKRKQQKEVTSEQGVKNTSERLHSVFTPKKRKPQGGQIHQKWGQRGLGRMDLPETGELLAQQKKWFSVRMKIPTRDKDKRS